MQTQFGPFRPILDLTWTILDLFRTNLYPFRPKFDLCRPNLDPFRSNLDSFRPNLEPIRLNLDSFRLNFSPIRPNLDPFRHKLDPLRPYLNLFRSFSTLIQQNFSLSNSRLRSSIDRIGKRTSWFDGKTFSSVHQTPEK